MLWRRALGCRAAPSTTEDSGAAAQDDLVYAVVTALADLLVIHGGDELAAVALRILFDPRFAAWHDATAAEASQPLRVAAAAQRLMTSACFCPCASLGVRACRPRRPLSPPFASRPQLARNSRPSHAA